MRPTCLATHLFSLFSLFLPVLLLPTACTTPRPSQPPATLGSEIIEHLDHGRQAEATAAFAVARRHREYREKIYPLVYEEARRRHTKGDMPGSARLLRFLNQSYPKAMAVREALLYTLFIWRAQHDKADPKELEETDRLLRELRAGSSRPSAWVELAAAQHAVDSGRPSDARAALARFKKRWNGRPRDLSFYLGELERYLQAHGDDAGGTGGTDGTGGADGADGGDGTVDAGGSQR